MNDPLRGPKLKIERARHHIRDTETAVRDFISRNPYHMFEEMNRKTREKHIKVNLPRDPIPGDVEGAAGDAVHNLRVSLDQLACCLAALNGFPRSRSTYFPFGNDRHHFESSGVQDKVRRLSQEAKDLIATEKPYRGGNDLLWSLHALDLMDKHRQLVPTQSTGSGVVFSGTTSGPMTLIANPRWSPAEDNMTVAIIDPDTQPAGRFQIFFNVAFAEVEPVKGQPIVSVLDSLADLVEHVLVAFEGRFFT